MKRAESLMQRYAALAHRYFDAARFEMCLSLESGFAEHCSVVKEPPSSAFPSACTATL